MLFSSFGLELTMRAHADAEYPEDYSGGPDDLLAKAVDEVSRRSGGGTLFFIEDTSIRIEALSTAETDEPGLRAKEWFAETSFSALNSQLMTALDRRAKVTSRIALSLPGLGRAIVFEGHMSGTIVEQPASFNSDPLYPWLAADNFSAWLVPDGADRSLSEMSFEESLDYDFRVKSLEKVIDRLEEYAIAANAGPPIFTPVASAKASQPTLFSLERPITLVVGPTCSGKSTLGAIAQTYTDAEVVDASSIVRVLREERGEKDVPIGSFATRLLSNEGPDVVARHIWPKWVDERSRESPLIITGFRAIEEVEFFRESTEDIRVISIETPPRIRYERYQSRAAREPINTFAAFEVHDAEQHSLGLLSVASALADLRIDNVYSLETYYAQVATALNIQRTEAPGVTTVRARLDPERSQLLRCLQVLRKSGRPLTTQEIESQFPPGHVIRYNNANKMLKRYPELVRRQESKGTNVRYQITTTGLAFLSAVEKLQRD
jgi:dephospho-CoA kinase/inosine/xanthosine triphosphate pyrophosphatase family protein